jgi:hypothetical protein
MKGMTPEQSQRALPIERQPDYYRKPTILCGEITAWTRGKMDEECVVELQDRTNKLAKKLVKMSILNVESDQHAHVLNESHFLRERFETVRKKLIAEKIRFIREVSKDRFFAHTEDIAVSIKTLIENLENWPENMHEDIQHFSQVIKGKDLKRKSAYFDFRKAHKTFLSQKKRLNVPRLLKADIADYLEAGYLYFWSDFLLRKLDEQEDLSRVEEQVGSVYEHVQKSSKFSLETQSPFSEGELQQGVAQIKKWLNNAFVGTSFLYNHEFVSEEEKEKKKQAYGGSDYSDHLRVKFTAVSREGETVFDVFISETLGAATFAREQKMQTDFALKNFLEDILPQIMKEKDLTESDVSMWNEYKHVDRECRMIQGKITGLTREEAEVVVDKLSDFLQMISKEA